MASIAPVIATPLTSPLHPEIKWAQQRKDRLLLTVGSSDVKVTFQNDDTLHFQGVSGGTAYESVLQFYDTIDAEASTCKVLLDPFGSM